MPVFLRYEIEEGLRAAYLPNQMIFGIIMFHCSALGKSNKANILGGRGLNVHPLDSVETLIWVHKHIFQHILLVYWTNSGIFQFSN